MAGAPYLQGCREHDDVSPTSAKAVDMSRESARGVVLFVLAVLSRGFQLPIWEGGSLRSPGPLLLLA